MAEYDDLASEFDGGWDDEEGFTVDVSDKEAASEARSFELLPKGMYKVRVDDVDLEEVQNGKNVGKHMYNFHLLITEGQYEGRKIYNRAMLWSGALYTIVQMMKAVGQQVNEGSLKIPPGKWWIGKEMVAIVTVDQQKAKDPDTEKYTVLQWEDEEKKKPKMQNNVRGLLAIDDPKVKLVTTQVGAAPAKSTAGMSDLLPS
jgi:hypothetical protein